jgi:hypothetical protein
VSRPLNFIPRGRLAAWLAFGATGLATGAVWATGFAEVGATNVVTNESPAIAKTAPTPASSALKDTVSAVDPIALVWNGRWGKITTPKVMFKVDLSGNAFDGTNRYNIALLLANTSALTGWASLQFEFEQVAIDPGETCDPTAFDGTKNAQILNVDDQDAGVYWNNLVGDKIYCLGIFTSAGDDDQGTFLRAAQDTAPSGFPSFITTVDRAA